MNKSVVRISNKNCILGVGVLISSDTLLTCAHVDRGADTTITFPLLDAPFNNKSFLAKRVKGNDSPFVDIAFLKIDGLPADLPVEPATFSLEEELKDRRIVGFGYPSDNDAGGSTEGRIGMRQGYGWMEIKGVDNFGYYFEPGFSGGGVYDDEAKVFYGIVNVADKKENRRYACYIPIKKVIEEFPELKEIIQFRSSFDDKNLKIQNDSDVVVNGNGNYIIKGIDGSSITINNSIRDNELKSMIGSQQKTIEQLIELLRNQTDNDSEKLLKKIEINEIEMLVEDATDKSVEKAIEKFLNSIGHESNTYTYLVNLKAKFKVYKTKQLGGLVTTGMLEEIIVRFRNIIEDYK